MSTYHELRAPIVLQYRTDKADALRDFRNSMREVHAFHAIALEAIQRKRPRERQEALELEGFQYAQARQQTEDLYTETKEALFAKYQADIAALAESLKRARPKG